MDTQSVKDFFRKNERSSYVVVVIILLLVAFYFLQGNKVSAPEINKEEITKETTQNTPVTSAFIVVENQPAGDTVTVKQLALTQISWVAVHEEKDGATGAILGAGRFRPENSTGVIELVTRNTQPGKTYYVVVHTDDGDDTFNYRTDIPFVINGKQVMASFSATEAETATQ